MVLIPNLVDLAGSETKVGQTGGGDGGINKSLMIEGK
jgi:hypothetical protein